MSSTLTATLSRVEVKHPTDQQYGNKVQYSFLTFKSTCIYSSNATYNTCTLVKVYSYTLQEKTFSFQIIRDCNTDIENLTKQYKTSEKEPLTKGFHLLYFQLLPL